MRIYTRLVLHWDGHQYLMDRAASFNYDGPIDLCCGATSAQNTAQQSQASFANQTQQQASSVFGNDSSVFNDLTNTFAPTLAAGPNQQGYSAAQLSNLNSQAITDTGQAYKNAKYAVGESEAAQGGGNNPDVGTGGKTATDLGIATSAAQQTSSELGQIQQADYAQGLQNYDTAAQDLEGAANVFNTTANVDNSANTSGEDAATTANQIATQNNSWIQGVTGALGGIAGAATGASINKWG